MNLKTVVAMTPYVYDPLTPADLLLLQRIQSGQVPVTLAELPITTVSYEDQTVVTGATYTYRLIARGPGGDSAPSDATVRVTVPAPAAPGPLTVSVQAA